MTIPLSELLQEVEHSGCASGRARAILVIAESCSTNTITRCAREYIAREQPTQPNIPDPLRTNYPPTPPAIDGFLQDVQQRAILNEVDNLLVDLANQFHRAGHANSFSAARAYLTRLVQYRCPDTMPTKKRRRLL